MAFQKRWALSVPYEFPLTETGRIAREMQDLGYTDAWSYEVDGIDAFLPLAVVAQATDMRVGTAIVNVYTRGPATLAESAAGMAELAPGRFILGIGSGSQPIVEKWNGGKFERPATRVKEMVQVLRQALAGEKVVFDGKAIKVDGFRCSRPPKHEVPIHVAALREGMLRIAGEVADGVCVNWLSAEDVKQSVAVVRDAAAKAGRDPESIEVTARLMINIDPPGPETDNVIRRSIAAYLNVPVYREFHEWLGRTPQLQGMWDQWKAGDRKAALEAIPRQTMDELIIQGSPEERRAHVKAYLDAGVDTAFMSFTTTERDAAKRHAMVMQALKDHAPAAY
ncbi:MAG: LLM class F420-dependent oxidoreductase [Dehalococcoidia bacterium]|nr:LLM class F420-dependent oxidoreductase [Dehalococcoidia bacterium]